MESRRYYRAAQYWIARGDWVLGEELCWKALAALKESDPDHAHGAIRNNLVRPLMKNGKVDQAIEMGLAALVYNKRGRDPVGIACNYMNLGDAYEMKGDLAKRDAYWEMARTVAVENNLKETLPYIERRIKGAKRR
jgi:tetratricopeptide (TPR) repeat protein